LAFTGQPGALRQLDLNELSLSNLDLSSSISLVHQFKFLRLKKLRIKYCILATNLINAIANEFVNSTQAPLLEVLETGYPDDDFRGQHADEYEYIQALEAPLNSFTGLKGLSLDYTSQDMVHTDCIIRHAATLERLSFGSYNSQEVHRLSGQNLETVLIVCTKLTQLGLPIDAEVMNMRYDDDAQFLPVKTGPLYIWGELVTTMVSSP
jgi:hypothetical protein